MPIHTHTKKQKAKIIRKRKATKEKSKLTQIPGKDLSKSIGITKVPPIDKTSKRSKWKNMTALEKERAQEGFEFTKKAAAASNRAKIVRAGLNRKTISQGSRKKLAQHKVDDLNRFLSTGSSQKFKLRKKKKKSK